MRRSFADKIAKKDLQELRNFSMNPAQSIERLAHRLGIAVVEIDLESGIDGYIECDPLFGGKSGYTVYINKNLTTQRKRWTLAHEIGHYFLHSDNPDLYFGEGLNRARGKSANFAYETQEREANYFAEDLFFAPNSLEAALNLHGENIQYLAMNVFGVPEAALQIALAHLKRTKGDFSPKKHDVKFEYRAKIADVKSTPSGRIFGFEDEPCAECGNRTVVKNASCFTCHTCGGTSGCS